MHHTTTIIHPEALQLHHHAAMLAAHDKTLNRVYHNGIEIEQKVDGYRIAGFYDFVTLQQAIDFIERRSAFHFIHPHLEMYNLTLWAENCMLYKCGAGQCEQAADKANAIIAKYKLPLTAEATTFPTQDSFIIQKA